jgi:hypothetical protein
MGLNFEKIVSFVTFDYPHIDSDIFQNEPEIRSRGTT